MGIILLYFINSPKEFILPGGTVISNVLKLDDLKKEDEYEPFNLLLLGGDVSNSLTDTMMVLNYNQKNKKISLLSIPRDTKANDEKYGIVKINSVYSRNGKGNNGIKKTIQSVENILHINIKYFIFVDTTAFKKTIDVLGGVDYVVNTEMHYDDPTQNLHIHFEPGKYLFDGQMAEEYMRFRKPNRGNYTKDLMKYYDGSDLKRIDAQQNFIKELIKQKATIKSIGKLNDILQIVLDSVNSNLDFDTIFKTACNFIDIHNDIAYNFFKIDGYSEMINSQWYYIYNFKINNNTNDELLNCDDVLKIYFSDSNKKIDSYDYIDNIKPTFTPTPDSIKTKNPELEYKIKNNNPSNQDTNIKPTNNPV